jgi:hypothetical protein
MMYAIQEPNAEGRRSTQYFEIVGNRASYHDGRLAGPVHRAPWEANPRRPLQEDAWELYDTRSDFSLVNDLAAQQPRKLAEIQKLFMKEASINHALPLDDRLTERLNPAIAGRPDLMGGRTSLTVYEGMVGHSENVFINIKNRSHSITAEVEVPEQGAEGVVLAQAGRFGGWSQYVKDGKPTYNYLYQKRTHIVVDEKLAPGREGRSSTTSRTQAARRQARAGSARCR